MGGKIDVYKTLYGYNKPSEEQVFQFKLYEYNPNAGSDSCWGQWKNNQWTSNVAALTTSQKNSSSLDKVYDSYTFDISSLLPTPGKDDNTKTVYFKITESENTDFEINDSAVYVKLTLTKAGTGTADDPYTWSIKQEIVDSNLQNAKTSRVRFINTPKTQIIVKKKWIDENGQAVADSDLSIDSLSVDIYRVAHLPGSYTNFMLNQAITKSSDTNSTVTIPGFMSESIPTGSTVTLYISVNQNGKWLLSKLSNLIEALGIYSGSALITNAWQEVSTDIGYDNNSYCNCYSISFKLPASLSECSYVLSGAVSGLDDNFGNIGQCFELRLTYNLPTGWERDVEDEAAFKTVVLSKENGWKWSSYSGTTNYLPLAGPFTYEGVNYSDVEFSYYVKEAESSNYEISSVVVNSSEYTTNGTATMAISSGNITITNKLKSQSYTLPETGGSGSRTYITFGFCVIVAASLLTLLLHRRRRT